MNEESEEMQERLSVTDVSESHKQLRAVVFWLGIVFAGLVFYVFGFPIFYILADDQGWLPELVDEIFFTLLTPLEWLYNHNSLYERWIDWFQNVVV